MFESFYLLLIVSVTAGFFMRPLSMFVFGRIFSLAKYLHNKPLIVILGISSVLATIATTMSTIYLSLKISGFIPLEEHTPVFVVSFIVGGAIWVVYARRNNLMCSIDVNQK